MGMLLRRSSLDGKIAFHLARPGSASRHSEAERMAWTVAPLSLRVMAVGVLPMLLRVLLGTVRSSSSA
jgi:hypothetical protein